MENNYNNQNNEYNYNPYTNPERGFEYRDSNTNYYTNQNRSSEVEPKKGKGAFEGFGVTLIKTVAIALVFGLVSGVACSTVLHFSGITLGLFSETENSVDVDDDVQELQQTIPGGLQQTNTENIGATAVMDVSDIVENAMPCVVAISNKAEVTYQSFWGQVYTEESESAGTGFIVKQDQDYLYIATNNHVVEGASELTVQFCDSSTAVAEIKGTVASKDLAVIKVKTSDISDATLEVIRVATLGDSNNLEVGESAIAIGNALGYGQSVTTGVISALGRSVTVADTTTGTTIIVNNNLIQTDAAINPGNSGGALLNVKGEVIGINSVKYADTDVEGIGYAIPISDAMLIINKLIDGEKVDETQSGYLGIQGQDSSLGAYVYYVFPGSAAEKAGIQKGDIITEFEGTTIATMSQLKELLSYHPAGDKVDFVILRPQNDEYVEIEVTVELGDISILPQ